MAHFQAVITRLGRWKLGVKSVQESAERTFYDYRKADTESISRELQSVDWVELFSGLSAELSWLLFKDYLELLQQKYIPFVHRTHKCGKPLWYSRGVVINPTVSGFLLLLLTNEDSQYCRG